MTKFMAQRRHHDRGEPVRSRNRTYGAQRGRRDVLEERLPAGSNEAGG